MDYEIGRDHGILPIRPGMNFEAITVLLEAGHIGVLPGVDRNRASGNPAFERLVVSIDAADYVSSLK